MENFMILALTEKNAESVWYALDTQIAHLNKLWRQSTDNALQAENLASRRAWTKDAARIDAEIESLRKIKKEIGSVINL